MQADAPRTQLGGTCAVQHDALNSVGVRVCVTFLKWQCEAALHAHAQLAFSWTAAAA